MLVHYGGVMLKRISVTSKQGYAFVLSGFEQIMDRFVAVAVAGLSAPSRYHSRALSYFTHNHINLSAKSNMMGLALQESSGTSRCLLLTSLVDTVNASCKGFTFLLTYLHTRVRHSKNWECFASTCNPSSFRRAVPCEMWKEAWLIRVQRQILSVHSHWKGSAAPFQRKYLFRLTGTI